MSVQKIIAQLKDVLMHTIQRIIAANTLKECGDMGTLSM